MTTLLGLTVFATLFSIVLALAFEIAVARTGTVQPLEAGTVDGSATRVSVVIPARNEEEDIERAVESVLAQRGVDLQVVVVNDHSSDRTGEILDRLRNQDSRISVIDNPPLQPNWLGKPNAMHHGVQATDADLVLLTDADIIHGPTAFATGVSLLDQNELDFISFFPRIVCRSFWENVLLPLSLFPLIAQFALGGPNNPKTSAAAAAGAFMLVRRKTLVAIGGIESVKSEIMDDIQLARVIKQSGHRVQYHLGPNLMSVRIFKGNHHAFWGPTKNVIAMSFSNPWMSLPTMALPFLIFWLPIATAVVGFGSGDLRLATVGLIQPLLCLLSLVRIRSLCDFQWSKAIFYPFIAVPSACVLARAFYEQKIRGTLIWRHRSINLTPEMDISED